MGLDKRVTAALQEDASRAYAETYLALLTTNWVAAKDTARKTLAWLLGSAAAFELIAAAQLREATVAGLEISNFSTVEKLLPVVVAYLAFQLVVLHTMDAYFQRIHSSVHGVVHAQLREQALHVALRPMANSWWEPSTLAYASGSSGQRARLLGQVWALATMLAIAAFEVLAYVRLFNRYGAQWLVLASLALSLLLAARVAAELCLETVLDS
jgi:hypothetical protein